MLVVLANHCRKNSGQTLIQENNMFNTDLWIKRLSGVLAAVVCQNNYHRVSLKLSMIVVTAYHKVLLSDSGKESFDIRLTENFLSTKNASSCLDKKIRIPTVWTTRSKEISYRSWEISKQYSNSECWKAC